MSELEEKLESVLKDPQLMQQIFAMAQTLGAAQPPKQERPKPQESTQRPQEPALDPKLLQTIAGFAQQSTMDSNQQALLRALSPYLSRQRLQKLERAMGAARMAGAASAFLGAGGLQMLTGR